ncbi:MAG: hypothetical protein ACRENP_28330 [Longimicrobiales bacterium]
MRQFRLTALVLALASVGSAVNLRETTAQSDTSDLRRALRSSALEYERSLRRLAPYRMGGTPRECNEIVGRFCLYYDAGPEPALPAEPEGIGKARTRAIESFSAALDIGAADTMIALPLVRYLIEGGRHADAVAVARRFAQASADSMWASLLLGFALHAADSTQAAQRAFQHVLARMRPSEGEDWRDVRYLLAPAERPRYRELRGDARVQYENHLWRLADPLYLTVGNESLTEHFARQVYARILMRAPLVQGGVSWGEDLDELTQRFGVPKARTQDNSRSLELHITEHYDHGQLTYVPPEVHSNDGITLFEPGAAWPYDTIRARNGYAPATVRRMRVLEHQISRFPLGDSTLVRADLRVPMDSAVRLPARVELGLFLLDSAFQVVHQVWDTIDAVRDTVVGVLSLALPEAAVAYSLEARELGTRLSARARYLLPLPLLSRPVLSDLVMLDAPDFGAPAIRSSPAFRPLSTLRIPRNEPVAIYLEARGLMANDERQVRYRVDLEVIEQNRPGAVGRAVRRLGRALGLGGDAVAPRITWTEQAQSAGFVPIALKLGELRLDPGLKRFRVTVTDLDSGLSGSVERVVRIDRR